MNRISLIAVLFIVAACSGGGSDSGNSSSSSDTLEIVLANNTSWPYEVVGVLEIVEATYIESDYPESAVGAIVTEDDVWGVNVEIEGRVISRAGVDIDSGKKVRAWLDAPHQKYGVDTYPVSKLEAL